MIEPLKTSLVNLLLEGIRQNRLGNTYHTKNDVMRGVIQSFVAVEEYRKKNNLEVRDDGRISIGAYSRKVCHTCFSCWRLVCHFHYGPGNGLNYADQVSMAI